MEEQKQGSYVNPNLDQEDLQCDFDALVENPDTEYTKEQWQRVLDIVQRATTTKNTITLEEFEEFRPLFLHDARKNLGAREYDSLCCKWRARVSVFHPVKIVDNTRTKLIVELPPIFNRQNSVNAIGDIGPRLVAGLNASLTTLVDDFDIKKKKYFEATCAAYTAAQELIKHENVTNVNRILNNLKDTINPNLSPAEDKLDFGTADVEIL